MCPFYFFLVFVISILKFLSNCNARTGSASFRIIRTYRDFSELSGEQLSSALSFVCFLVLFKLLVQRKQKNLVFQQNFCDIYNVMMCHVILHGIVSISGSSARFASRLVSFHVLQP